MKEEFRKAPVTFCLAGVNVLVFFLNSVSNDMLMKKGMLYLVNTVYQKEYWRIFTAVFLHGGFEHIFSNMVTLVLLGMLLEEKFGKKTMLATYFLSGTGASLASLFQKYMQGSLVGTIGASGAIFGLDGMLLAKVLFRAKGTEDINIVRVILMILLSVYSGFSSPGIDNAAHVGGLITGFLVGIADTIIKMRKDGRTRRWT